MIRLTGQQGHRQCTRRPPLLLTAPPPPPPAAPPPSRQPHCCAAAVNMGILSYGIGDGVCDGGRGGRGCGSMSPLHITLPLSRLTADPCQDSQDLLHPDFIESTRNGEMVATVSYFHKMNSILQMKMQDAFLTDWHSMLSCFQSGGDWKKISVWLINLSPAILFASHKKMLEYPDPFI